MEFKMTKSSRKLTKIDTSCLLIGTTLGRSKGRHSLLRANQIHIDIHPSAGKLDLKKNIYQNLLTSTL